MSLFQYPMNYQVNRVVNIVNLCIQASSYYNSNGYVSYIAGEIAAVIVGVVLIITGLLVILAILFTLKHKNNRHRHVIRSLKSELR